MVTAWIDNQKLLKVMSKINIKQRLKMIWRILRDKQVVVITESYGKLYYNWDTRSLKDVCQMCSKAYNMAYIINDDVAYMINNKE